MASIELSQKELEEILDILPENLHVKIKESIKEERRLESGIECLRVFVERFDEHNDIDIILAHTCTSLMGAIIESCNKIHNKGINCIKGKDFALIVVKCLQEEANALGIALHNDNEECHDHKH